MSKNDYEGFLYKVNQLNKLIDLIDNSPEKYKLFTNCETHEEIVELANKWGYKIGKRWGEK